MHAFECAATWWTMVRRLTLGHVARDDDTRRHLVDGQSTRNSTYLHLPPLRRYR